MPLFQRRIVLWTLTFLSITPTVWAQRAPRIGYIYPAGGQRGDAFEVVVGGQYLDGARRATVSGEGVHTTVVKHTKPLTPKQVNVLRNKLEQARKQLQTSRKNGQRSGGRIDFKTLAKTAEEMGVDAEELKALAEFRKQRSDPKRQLNPQISETVTLQIRLDPDAEPGARELRLTTSSGLSNPLRFDVGQLPEFREDEPNDATTGTPIRGRLPVVINGQIMPGDVDRFGFEAHKGERLVISASARELIPYLADAVPGWFQATLAVYDTNGDEVAFADDYRFHPDPVLYYRIPANGHYVLEIKDAIYRGREDFVYRITLGETRFVTSVFPLGGHRERPTAVEVHGWNLPMRTLTLNVDKWEPGIHSTSLPAGKHISNHFLFAVDTLPECMEVEPNNNRRGAQRLEPPVIVNGRIDQPGDWDVFRFEGRAGNRVVMEVQSRRLNSPLDSLLKLTDADGRQLQVNDDCEDPGAGLNTHHADSQLGMTLPADAVYYLHLGDTQNKGGGAYGYRLRISGQRPDFELRVVPSSINVRPGMTVPITVHALRKDGFSGDITLALKDAPPGIVLRGGLVPAQHDKVRVTLTVSLTPVEEPIRIGLEGRAIVRGREISRTVVPADDMVQAFVYHHLVPAKDLMVSVSGRRWSGFPILFGGRGRFASRPDSGGKGRRGAPRMPFPDKRVKLPAGGTARVHLFARARAVMDRVQFELNEPPEGITIEKEMDGQSGMALLLHADTTKVKSGQRGNLIINAFMERTPPRRDGKPKGGKRRVPLGTLPAIPFEVVKR